MASVVKHIDATRRYNIPDDIKIILLDGNFLVVSAKTLNWVVLKNENQLKFLNLLKSHSIQNALSLYDGDYADAQYCVTQIEAKKFENKVLIKDDSSALIKMHIYLTNECNLRCNHCYMFSGERTEGELSTEEVIDLLANFKKRGGISVVFSGGEVSLRRDFGRILEYSHEIGLKNIVLTNGISWSEKQIDKLALFIDEIQISIDGYSEESNSSIRGVGVYAIALNTVEKFVKKNVKTSIGCTPILDDSFRLNYKEYIDWGRNLLEKYKGFDFHITFSGDLMNGRNVKLTEEEWCERQKNVDEIYEGVYGRSKDDQFVSVIKNQTLNDNCAFGMPSIAANGDVYFCSRVPNLTKIGNVRQESFDDIELKCKKAREVSNVDNLQPCKDCELRYICGGDCRVKYFDSLMQGTIDTVDNTHTPMRKCSQELKYGYYRLMIRVNDRLYSD